MSQHPNEQPTERYPRPSDEVHPTLPLPAEKRTPEATRTPSGSAAAPVPQPPAPQPAPQPAQPAQQAAPQQQTPQAPAYGTPPAPYGPVQPHPGPYGQYGPGQKSRLAAGLLGIFLGGLGIHRLYLGYTGIGVTMLLLTVVGSWASFGITLVVVPIWGFVEGILYLASKNGYWSVDARRIPLHD